MVIFALLFCIEQLKNSWEILHDRLALIFSRLAFLTRPCTSLKKEKKTNTNERGKTAISDRSRRVCFVFMSDRRWRGIDRFESAIVHRPGHTVLPPPVALHLCPPYVCSTCTRHLNTRARLHPPVAVSSSFPIMCKLYYFYPKYISPPCAAPRPPGSTGQIAHVHRKSPPGHGQLAYPSSALSQQLPTFHVGLPFFPKVTYIRT